MRKRVQWDTWYRCPVPISPSDQSESDLREQVKARGAIWRPRQKLWKMRYDDIVALGLESRVVAEDVPENDEPRAHGIQI